MTSYPTLAGNNYFTGSSNAYSGQIACSNYYSTTANLIIGTTNPYTETLLTSMQFMVKRGGNILIGGSSLNSNNNITIQGNNGGTIQIGGGSNNFSSGIINIGSTILNYLNTVNLCGSSTVTNNLNIGSIVCNPSVNGIMNFNLLPQSTILTYTNNNQILTKKINDTLYATLAQIQDVQNNVTTLQNKTIYQSIVGGQTIFDADLLFKGYATFDNLPYSTIISGTTYSNNNFLPKILNDGIYATLTQIQNIQASITNLATIYQPISSCSPDNYFYTTPYTLSSPFYDYYFIDRASLSNTITINLPNASLFGIGKQFNFICPISLSGINTTVIFILTSGNVCFDFNSTAANSNNIVLSKNSNYIQFTVFSSTTWMITSSNEAIQNLLNTYLNTTDAALNYVTFFYLANTLLSYVTISSLNSTLANYTTNSNLTTNYVSNTSLNSTLANYTTLTNLTANYVSKNSLATSISTSSLNVLGVSVYNNELQLKNTAYNSGTKYWRFFQTSSGAAYLFNVTTDVGVYINFNSTSWSANSDRRIKKNINYLSTELYKINQLKPCYYNYNQDDVDVLPRIGFIAQDVQNVYKNLVSQGSYSEELQDNILGVDMSSMIPYIIKAIQEIDSKIENLVPCTSSALTIEAQDKKIADLENQISILNLRLSDALKTNNDSLEAKLTSLINMLSLKGIIDKKKL
jgi:hypothetical protein